jgi:hypothetical protein
MFTTSYINLTNEAKVIGITQASIKIKAPDAYHKKRSKL